MANLASLVATTPVLGRPTLVAVDGVDGSGKTTFAESLATAYTDRGRAVYVVHMDDFLNPRSVRHRMGRTSPVSMRAFDHLADKPVHDEPVNVPPQAVVVVEGMFLHRDELRTWWDMSIFLDVPFLPIREE